MSKRIMLAGGGTGGHIYPLIAVAEEILKVDQTVELEFIGTGQILRDEAGKLGIPFKNVLSSKWRRYFSLKNIIDIIKFPIGFIQSLFLVWKYMPDAIFAKGGYASLLPALAGKILMIPIVVHETDSIPGKTNIFLSKLARKTFVGFASSIQYFSTKYIETVGNPMRLGILNGGDRNIAAGVFNLKPDRPTILITGAGQGAKVINDILVLSLSELVKEFQIIHQTGPKNFEEIKRQVEQIEKEGGSGYGSIITENYRVYPIFDLQQMASAYSLCDVIISRSGSQVFETAAVAKPTVLIPLKNSGNNHQLANALEMAKFGAIVIEEDNLTPHLFINEIKMAYNNRTEISQKIRGFARTDAAQVIAGQILEF
jgi:UDP-N-acetylglucosamine--N-acetylmuramyl-(pentapeptide) pyrophosphoryl-undecaprenol N-acetylglucosamine transferase